jgi:hypothetical protein
MRQYHSRLQQVEEQKSIKSAVVFGGLTVLIIILAVLFGITAFSKIINIFNKKSTQTEIQSSTLSTPNLETLPQYTKDESIVIKGTTSPNSTVKVFFNNSSDEASSNDNGSFAINVSLTKGANTIYAKTIDNKGNESASSNSYTVNFSNQVPNLTVNSPQNNQNFYGDTQKALNVQGSTDINNQVTVNDHIAIVDPAGKFNYSINLQDGDNNLKIISTDQAGNKKEIDLKVTFNP